LDVLSDHILYLPIHDVYCLKLVKKLQENNGSSKNKDFCWSFFSFPEIAGTDGGQAARKAGPAQVDEPRDKSFS
jgi:hypothetical protein